MAISTAVQAGSVARTVGIKTEYKDLKGGNAVNLPQRVVILGQGATAATYATDKQRIFSAKEAGDLYGYGSPIHLVAQQLFPSNGDGVGNIPVTVLPLEDDGAGIVADWVITPAGTATSAGSFRISQGGVLSEAVLYEVGDTVADLTAAITAAITATLDSPTTATDNTTDATLAAKWAGASANQLTVTIEGLDASHGLTIGVAAGTSGLNNPDVDPALALIGDVWETMIINCMQSNDETTLDKISTFGEGRWGALTRKPLVSFVGDTDDSASAYITFGDGRKTDRTNILLPFPGSPALGFVAVARAVARIVVRANNEPAWDYPRLLVDGIEPGADELQWMYNERDAVVKAGVSVTRVIDDVIQTSDTVTFYHPTGEEPPAYRFLKTIVKLQNTIYNFNLRFESATWDGAPLLPDDQATVVPGAKRPRMAVAEAASIVDGLAAVAILSDPEGIKETIQAEIDGSNPDRLNMSLTVKVSGNVNILSIDLNFGFFFGGV